MGGLWFKLKKYNVESRNLHHKTKQNKKTTETKERRLNENLSETNTRQRLPVGLIENSYSSYQRFDDLSF